MKKFFFFLSTIALLGLASACVEQISSDNPNYNPEKGEVKTQFIINISSAAQTKAPADSVQALSTSPFRGMEEMKLFMSKGYGSNYLTGSYQYDLGQLTPLYSEDNLTVAGSINSENSRRVYNMTIPTGVDNMVFYAKTKKTASSDGNGTAANNKIVFNVKSTKGETNFQLVPITEDEAVFTTNTTATALLNILNRVIEAEGWKSTDNDDVTLATAYNNLITTNEVFRQGSGHAILRTMEDLYKIVLNRTDQVSVNIKNILDGFFTATTTGTTTKQLTDFVYKNDTDDALLNFPENLNLPVGVAQVSFVKGNPQAEQDQDKVDHFIWVTPSNSFVITGATADDVKTVNYLDLMYPAEICYWADSPIRVSNKEGVEEDPNYYPKGDANTTNWSKWDDNNSWLANYGWDASKTAVDKDTRAVALKNNVLYGNALAKFIVKMGESGYTEEGQSTPNNTIFLDNRAALVPALSDQKITIDGTNGYFTVSGILIGGQPKQVDWNFVAKDSDRTGVIYDHVFDYDGKLDANKEYYVPVFDNYSTGGAQPAVYFALELVNHAGDFYGKDNVIYDGGKFYLTGKLELPTNASITDLSSLAQKGYRIPPLSSAEGSEGTMAVTPRIFIQDFVTVITATLGPNVLKHAYATIPDLRPIEMYFGLSVDLSWKAGASLSVEL